MYLVLCNRSGDDVCCVTQIMNTWTRQKGYPVLTLTRQEGTDGEVKYRVEQDRFLADPDARSKDDDESEFGYRWEVPVTYVTSGDRERKQLWLHADGDELEM